MNYTFRIKEVAINKDGTNVWFYPEIKISKHTTTGILWWAKSKFVDRWERIFKNAENDFVHLTQEEAEDRFSILSIHEKVVGFRSMEEVNDFIKKYDEELSRNSEKFRDTYYKYVGSLTEAEGEVTKYHDIKS